LDMHTLHVEHVVLLALYTFLTLANSSLYKGVKGIHWFSLYNLAALLGAIAVALRGQIPDFLSIVIGNLLVVAGYFFFSLSLAAFFGRKTAHFYLQGGLLIVAIITMVQYGWLHNDTPKRLIAYSIVLGCQQAQMAFFLLRQKRDALRVATFTMSFILACLSLANILRVIGVSMHGAPNNYLNAGAFLAWIVIANSGLQCGAIVSYVWMTAAHLREDLQVQASTDPLTGLLNRRAIEVTAGQKILACSSTGSIVSAMILDLDGFKQINDTFGHHCGDATLMTVATCLQRGLRKGDLLARIGGDEFAILLPDTSLETATTVAAELQMSIERAEVLYGPISTSVTISFGIAQLNPPVRTWEQLLVCCDKALYEAKRSRRLSPPPLPVQDLPIQGPSLDFADAELS
jgi:diguanylate cyclase (GGDEF)-like protein